MREIYNDLDFSQEKLSYEVFRYAIIGYLHLKESKAVSDEPIIGIIDFSMPSTKKRFFILDLGRRRVELNDYVAHGKYNGWNYATKFSNVPNSNMSSIGFAVTEETTYVGAHGESLRLHGKEKDFNHNMYERAIVIHAADYVSKEFIDTAYPENPRLGRSFGCPAVSNDAITTTLDMLVGTKMLFTYANQSDYLQESRYLKIRSRIHTEDNLDF